MYKRGQAQQFNWIFVTVVGIIILLFFLGFLVKYIDLQDSKKNAEIASYFSNSILSMKGISQYKNFSVSQPFGVDYDCENLIVNEDQKFRVPTTLVMNKFNTNSLVFWTAEYKKGFLVDRVVFVSDSNLKYYFESEDYLEELPPNIKTTEFIDNADVVVSSSNVDHLGKKDIYVNGDSITFVEEGKTFTFDDEFYVYVAAFSNSRIFECTKNKLDENFERLKQVYLYKIDQVSMHQGGFCNYNNIRNSISEGNVESMNQMNNNLANLNCEVVF